MSTGLINMHNEIIRLRRENNRLKQIEKKYENLLKNSIENNNAIIAKMLTALSFDNISELSTTNKLHKIFTLMDKLGIEFNIFSSEIYISDKGNDMGKLVYEGENEPVVSLPPITTFNVTE